MLQAVTTSKPVMSYRLTNAMLKAMHDIESVRDFRNYFTLTSADVEAARKMALVQKLKAHLQLAGQNLAFSEVKTLTEIENPQTDLEQFSQNLLNLYRNIGANSQRPTVQDAQLRQMHVSLYHKMPQVANAGILRGQNQGLFSSSQNVFSDSLPNYEETVQLVQAAINWAGNTTIPALIKIWPVYYYLKIAQPFEEGSNILASLAAFLVLEKEGFAFDNLLLLDDAVFNNETLIAKFEELQQDGFVADEGKLNEIIETGLSALNNHLQSIKNIYVNTVRQHIVTAEMNSRQKNRINFWLQRAFFHHKDTLLQLSDRQQEIILLLLNFGEISTRELVSRFEVDRKTVQRDFVTLLEYDIVTSDGAGRNIKYTLNFHLA